MQRYTNLSNLVKTNTFVHRDAVIAIFIVSFIATCYLVIYLIMAVANAFSS